VVNTAVDGDATKLHPVPFFSGYTVPANLPVSEPLLEHDGTSGRNHLRLGKWRRETQALLRSQPSSVQ
jgi:hypothetical protein